MSASDVVEQGAGTAAASFVLQEWDTGSFRPPKTGTFDTIWLGPGTSPANFTPLTATGSLRTVQLTATRRLHEVLPAEVFKSVTGRMTTLGNELIQGIASPSDPITNSNSHRQ